MNENKTNINWLACIYADKFNISKKRLNYEKGFIKNKCL